LAANDRIAADNRAFLRARGIAALNLISAPGSGKTALLERTLEHLRSRVGCAVIVGDVQTDRDARRLADRGAPVLQIETHSSCHLDARHIAAAMPQVVGPGTRLLLIENVGNLVCPAAFDLGETAQIALMSVTEGEDKPRKYPVLFSQAPVAVVTKVDLVPHLRWDMAACRESIRSVRPDVMIFELSAFTGDGMDAWLAYLEGLTG
jgi:hydrogenase nickel incorporation protein HypB